MAIFQVDWVSRYQNVSILDFIGAEDDATGSDNWSYKTCRAPVKSSPPSSQHPAFYRLDALENSNKQKFKSFITQQILK